MTDYSSMLLSYYDIQCTPASIAPFVDISSCVTMKSAVGIFIFGAPEHDKLISSFHF